jgi:hypothetical protein
LHCWRDQGDHHSTRSYSLACTDYSQIKTPKGVLKKEKEKHIRISVLLHFEYLQVCEVFDSTDGRWDGTIQRVRFQASVARIIEKNQPIVYIL